MNPQERATPAQRARAHGGPSQARARRRRPGGRPATGSEAAAALLDRVRKLLTKAESDGVTPPRRRP